MSEFLLNNVEAPSKRQREDLSDSDAIESGLKKHKTGVGVDDISALEELKIRSGDLTSAMQLVYLQQHADIKEKVDDIAAQISVRQSRLTVLNEIRAAINTATTAENELDITEDEELKTKIKRAVEEFGVDLPKFDENKMKYSTLEKDRLIQNLDLAADGWDKENRSQTQKIEIHQKELDRLMTMLTSMRKEESQAGTQVLRNIKG